MQLLFCNISYNNSNSKSNTMNLSFATRSIGAPGHGDGHLTSGGCGASGQVPTDMNGNQYGLLRDVNEENETLNKQVDDNDDEAPELNRTSVNGPNNSISRNNVPFYKGSTP
jgi:hypothetical protein